MGRAEKVQWECDAPGCGITESKRVTSRYDDDPPKGWSHCEVVIVGEDLEGSDCDCKCHDYEEEAWDEDTTPGWHDEEDCKCQDYDGGDRGDFFLCTSCTQRLKQQFIRPA